MQVLSKDLCIVVSPFYGASTSGTIVISPFYGANPCYGARRVEKDDFLGCPIWLKHSKYCTELMSGRFFRYLFFCWFPVALPGSSGEVGTSPSPPYVVGPPPPLIQDFEDPGGGQQEGGREHTTRLVTPKGSADRELHFGCAQL